jgi:predicted HAD superfamily Cof-like phosphohydrolase
MNNDVVKFIEACEQERNEQNVILYQKLIREEFDEFMRDFFAGDEVGQLDGCMDLIWVTLGYCYMKGFDVEGAWAEVARSNLSKIDPETGKVSKRKDGKVLKPEGWTPPELKPFVKQK